ncbi:FAD dependent oxidoreductase [Leucosporidium creatinivorum]|uniref:FAD dependent oxidoreductase n=1 Tax=Leucosporidium creatinivorum TaxID=106004 RepID=A0A1Y2G4P1_9BASI|nr:FAD dependent oxidoreductase [Leucosporidium creatinivorum]
MSDIVILGSGIVGLCSAYHLLKSPALPPNSTVTILENSSDGSIASGASSKAGGFIAGARGGWCGEPSTDLARLSWECHLELVNELGGREKWGWRECGAVGLRVGGGGQSRSAYRDLPKGKKEVSDRDWLNGEREDLTNGAGGVAAAIGQIDPEQFCRTLHAHLSKDQRFKTIFGSTKSLSPATASPSSPRTLTFVKLGEKSTTTIRFNTLIIAAGPWSADVCSQLNLPKLNLVNLPGTSLLIRPALHTVGFMSDELLPSSAVFAGIGDAVSGVHAATSGTGRQLTEEEIAMGCTAAPELFPRTNGLVYIAGENSTPTVAADHLPQRLPNRLPDNVVQVKQLVDPLLVQRLTASAAAVSSALDVSKGAVIEKEQFCYRPKTHDGEAIIGELTKGTFVATGHGPWGITLAPGTGKIVAELVLTPGKPLSADISGLGLSRFASKL